MNPAVQQRQLTPASPHSAAASAAFRACPLQRSSCFVPRSTARQALPKARQHRLICHAAAAGTRLIAPAAQASTTGTVFVTGDGALAARITRELLQSGFKVTSGTPSLERTEALLDFAKRVELITRAESSKLSLIEVDLSDEDAIAAALPKRGGRVVVALGDVVGRQRIDAKVASRILGAAKAVNAAQFVLVAPAGSSGGAGFLGGLFGGGGGSGSSQLEQEAVNSGIACIILRTGKAEGVDDSLAGDSSVKLAPQGSLPPSATITKGQVAEVVAQLLRQAEGDVAVEAWADRGAEPQDIAALVAEVLPSAAIESEEADEEEEEEETPAPLAAANDGDDEGASEKPATPLRLPFGGTQRVRRSAPDQASSAPQPPQKRMVLPRPGTARIKAAAQDAAEEVGEEAPKLFGGLFGGAKRAAQGAAEEAEEAAEKPRSPLAGLLGGTRKISAKAEGAAKQAGRAGKRAMREVQSAADEEPKGNNPFARLLGGAKKAEASAERQVKVSAKEAQKSVEKSSRRLRAKAGAAGEEVEKPRGGFLQSLGIGQDTYYPDDS